MSERRPVAATQRWRWKYADEAARQELGEHPEELVNCEAVESVKTNPVRRVYRCGDYFWKQDYRHGRRLAGEFRSAEIVRQFQLPVVTHLAWGRARGQGSVLITRALPDAETSDRYFWREYVWEGGDPQPFLRQFADFTHDVLRSGLWHPDFHAGNILYQPDKNRFTLVDVRGVRRRHFFDEGHLYRMRRIGLEFREILDDGALIDLLQRCGLHDAARFLPHALKREAAALRKEWPKRRKQILEGYPKFTRMEESGRLTTLTPTGTPALPESFHTLAAEPEVGRDYLLVHFFLQLARIPHLAVGGIDPESQTMLFEKAGDTACLETASADFRNRLALYGVTTGPEDWILHHGRPALKNLYVAATQLL